MMEQPPSPERLVTKEELLEALRAQSPEAQEMALQWTLQREKEVGAEGTPRASVLFNAERHELYLAASDLDGAIEALQDAQDQAYQEHFDDIVEELEAKINKLKAEKA